MPEKITYSASAAVSGGPTIGFSRELIADGYNKTSFVIAKGATQKVFLGTADGAVFLLMVTSSHYAPKLTYTVEKDTKARPLDEPLLISGSGAMAILGSPTFLTFTNDNVADEVTIEVFVARDPTP